MTTPSTTASVQERASFDFDDSQCRDYTFLVTVRTKSIEHAERVMDERLGPDEEYGYYFSGPTYEVVEAHGEKPDDEVVDTIAEMVHKYTLG